MVRRGGRLVLPGLGRMLWTQGGGLWARAALRRPGRGREHPDDGRYLAESRFIPLGLDRL